MGAFGCSRCWDSSAAVPRCRLLVWQRGQAGAGVQVRTDWAGLIEEWGRRFFAEMDYEAEAASAELFAHQMAGLPGIAVPAVYHHLTTRRVLTTDWIEGAPLAPPLALISPSS